MQTPIRHRRSGHTHRQRASVVATLATVVRSAVFAMTRESWNALVAPGPTIFVGFLATWSGTNFHSTAFSLNGIPDIVAA